MAVLPGVGLWGELLWSWRDELGTPLFLARGSGVTVLWTKRPRTVARERRWKNNYLNERARMCQAIHNLRGGTRDGSSTRSRSDPALGAAQGEARVGEPRGTRDSMQRAEEIRGQPR